MNGTIFDVKWFAVHDGEGLRTTLFLKGCSLRCPWCQNPEGLDPDPALWYNPTVCVGCGSCAANCPSGALTLTDRVHIDRTACVLCGKCVDLCPAGALSLCGRTVSARDPEEHRRLMGTDNRLILDNYRFLHDSGACVLTRTPLIPGFTDSEDNIRAIARFIRSVDPDASYELLNFNPLCRSKYSALERDYPVAGGALSPGEMERFYDILAQEGIAHIIKE